MSLLLFFAFQGGESGLAVSGEVRNPAKTIPRAIMISILGVMGLYLLVQLVAQGILGAQLPAYKEGPLAEAGRVMFGPLGFTLITVGAAYSMFGTLSGTMLSIPRVAYSAALDGVIGPRMLARVHPRFATPNFAIGAYASAVCILAILGGFRQLAVASGAFVLMIYLGVVLCVFRLRQTASADATTFRVPGGVLIPVIAILAIIGVLSGLEQKEWIAGLIFSGIFSGIYLLMNLMKRRSIIVEPVG
jgi:amino acid transporter